MRGAAGVLKHEAGRQERTAVAAVWALCAGFGVEVGGDPPRHLDGVGPRVGRGLSGPSKFRKRTPPRAPILGPLEAFDLVAPKSTPGYAGGKK